MPIRSLAFWFGGRGRQHLVAECTGKSLTPWSNDPVSDAPAEVLYIRDDENGDLWSATPLPDPPYAHAYVIRHGFGYSRFEHISHGISLDLLQFVPLEDSDEDFASQDRQSLRSVRGNFRSLTMWIGCSAIIAAAAPFIVTEIDPKTGACSPAIPGAPISDPDRLHGHGWPADRRTPAIGRNLLAVTARWPNRRACRALAAVESRRRRLDPCGAMQTHDQPAAGRGNRESCSSSARGIRAEAVALIERYRSRRPGRQFLGVTDFWTRRWEPFR